MQPLPESLRHAIACSIAADAIARALAQPGDGPGPDADPFANLSCPECYRRPICDACPHGWPECLACPECITDAAADATADTHTCAECGVTFSVTLPLPVTIAHRADGHTLTHA